MNLITFLRAQRLPREPAAELLRRWIHQQDWEAVQTFAQYPGSLAALNSTPTAEREFGQALAEAGRWHELAAFEQSQPERLSRLIERANLLALPRDPVLGLPEASSLRRQMIQQAAEALAQGDMTWWPALAQEPEALMWLFELRAIPTFLDLCKTRSDGRSVAPPLWAMSQEALRNERYWAVPENGLTQDGDINQRHGAPTCLNVLDACAQEDDPFALQEALCLAPAGVDLEYPLDLDPDRAVYQNTGFGLVNSLLQHGSLQCLDAMQQRDPTFLFRPRQFWRQFGGPQDGLRHPLDDLFNVSVARRLARTLTGNPEDGDGHRRSVLEVLLDRLKPWGQAVLRPEHHEAWTTHLGAVQVDGCIERDALEQTLTWLQETVHLAPAVCPSQAQHLLPDLARRRSRQRPR